MRKLTPEGFLVFPTLALAIWIGCASTAPDKPPTTTDTSGTKAIREEFDPRSIQEDLLLIQPNFPRPTSDTSAVESRSIPAVTAATDFPPAPVESEPIAADDGDAELPSTDLPSSQTTTPVAEPSFRTETVTEHVYRVQIMALSNKTLARERAESLRATLGVPVFVKAQGPLFLVHVGSFVTRKEASAMQDRVTKMHNDYRDAYVIGLDETQEFRIPVFVDPEPPRPETGPEPETELVATFGWRVLLSQFLTNEDAIKEQRKIKRQYKRDDVDVTFAAPWYKVELGHFAIGEEARAQELAEFMKNKGFDALKVRSQVLIQKTNR